MTIKCDMRTWLASFTIPGSKIWPENIANFIEFSLFLAQISGFSTEFHSKLLDIVKQHPNNAGIRADGTF